VEEVYVKNERDVFTLRSEAEQGLWAIEKEGTHAYTCDSKLEDTKLEVAELEDRRLEDEALNDAELDDADLNHIYMHMSKLADDADDTKDEELADREYEDEVDSEDEDDNNKVEEVMNADLTSARISDMENEDLLINENEEDRNNNMPDDLMRVKRNLSTLRRLDGITNRAFGALRRYVIKFLVNEVLLFRRSKPNMLNNGLWQTE